MQLSNPANGPLSDPFGPRSNVPFSPVHHGQDIGFYLATYDMRIFAAAPGVVTEVYYNWALGNVIEIRHVDGTSTQYCHLADAGLVNVGDSVFRRQQIGTMGSTGAEAVVGGVRQTHLHFVYIVNGERVDPMPYMTGTAGDDPTPIEEEIEDSMRETRYLWTKDAGAGKPGYGIFGAEVAGGSRITSDVKTAEVWGAIWGTDKGAPWREMSKDQWPRLISEARAIHETFMAQQRSIYAGGPVGSGGAFTDADRKRLGAVPTATENAKAVNDDAAARLTH